MKLTTDMGDWSTLPKRIRLAIVSFLVGTSVVGIAAGIGVLSISAAGVLLPALGIVFDSFHVGTQEGDLAAALRRVAPHVFGGQLSDEIGRASCRERG